MNDPTYNARAKEVVRLLSTASFAATSAGEVKINFKRKVHNRKRNKMAGASRRVNR